jgi:hypothetical protein
MSSTSPQIQPRDGAGMASEITNNNNINNNV